MGKLKEEYKNAIKQYQGLITLLVEMVEKKNQKHQLSTKNNVILHVDSSVIEFLENHDIEVIGDDKFYIVNNIKYKYDGELKKVRYGTVKSNE